VAADRESTRRTLHPWAPTRPGEWRCTAQGCEATGIRRDGRIQLADGFDDVEPPDAGAPAAAGTDVLVEAVLCPAAVAEIGQLRAVRDQLADALRAVRRGGCWCECGVGNPMMGGVCADKCRQARAALARLGEGVA